jgi:hypothetical protein
MTWISEIAHRLRTRPATRDSPVPSKADIA